ncbi:hypothetical protein GYMLUDRAFT_65275 [Collybiopsis luxurians FD-317 M1]|uniref:Unplaced genomic scaffold GYMLUscaffold_155, whole genome shotgun sequence n=1 Tax=Collybiopsis luxurians FD-317 M1 TaxID=944289 RepID=A0A0D0C6T8_9AGAR|nr:hypothetical protein GYMLUDRAFT_65275 [Collybiopsis luxurians FD-317 M1]
MVFAGCARHNAFEAGVKMLHQMWSDLGKPGPCTLRNKAQDATIQLALENNDEEGLQHCVKSCDHGGTKLTALLGALYQHKNGETGYQDRYCIFMGKHKQIYGLDSKEAAKRFPDTLNTCYQSHTYTAAEVISFLSFHIQLIDKICDGKGKAGANHLEENILKGLNCIATIIELV